MAISNSSMEKMNTVSAIMLARVNPVMQPNPQDRSKHEALPKTERAADWMTSKWLLSRDLKGWLVLHVDRMSFGHFSSFLDHLRESGVSMDGGFDFIPGSLEVHGQANLCDQLRALAAHQVCADDFTVRFTVDDLHKALRFSCGQSFATGLVGELADLVFQTFFFRSALSETDAGDLGMAVGAAGEDTDFLWRVLGEHAFDSLHRLVAGHVGEPRRADDVTCAVNAFHGGLVTCIGFQPATVTQLQFNAARQDGGDTNRDQSNFGFEGFIGSAFDGDLHTLAVFASAGDLGVGEDADACFG